MYIPQNQSGPVIHPGTGFPFRRGPNDIFDFILYPLYSFEADPTENTVSQQFVCLPLRCLETGILLFHDTLLRECIHRDVAQQGVYMSQY
jgi:hypothetical protein